MYNRAWRRSECQRFFQLPVIRLLQPPRRPGPSVDALFWRHDIAVSTGSCFTYSPYMYVSIYVFSRSRATAGREQSSGGVFGAINKLLLYFEEHVFDQC